MIYKAKKLWEGKVSIRDYIVKKCLNSGEELLVDLHGEFKNYSLPELYEALHNNSNPSFKSKYDGKSYSLIDLPWK